MQGQCARWAQICSKAMVVESYAPSEPSPVPKLVAPAKGVVPLEITVRRLYEPGSHADIVLCLRHFVCVIRCTKTGKGHTGEGQKGKRSLLGRRLYG